MLTADRSIITNWGRGVKYLADTGMLECTVLVITGSDMVIIKEVRMRFPDKVMP